MIIVEGVIEGTTPLLQDKLDVNAEIEVQKTTRKQHTKKADPREEAEKRVHRDADGNVVAPSDWIVGTIREMARNYKQRSSRRALAFVIAGSVIPSSEFFPVVDPKNRTLSLRDCEVDSRFITNKVTKGKSIKHRPRFNAWAIKFTMSIDDDVVDPADIRQCLIDGGTRNGMGSFRPQRGGTFGMYHLVAWEQA